MTVKDILILLQSKGITASSIQSPAGVLVGVYCANFINPEPVYIPRSPKEFIHHDVTYEWAWGLVPIDDEGRSSFIDFMVKLWEDQEYRHCHSSGDVKQLFKND